jgi:hypothetical protein
MKIYWGRGGKVLATLVIEPAEWKKLVNYSAGLEKK